MQIITTFPQHSEFEKATRALDSLGLPYQAIHPGGYCRVGLPALVITDEVRAALAEHEITFTCAGWVEYREPAHTVPDAPPSEHEKDIFGEGRLMVLAPCVADPRKLRIVAHISGDLTEVFPYMNAEMREASYNVNGPTFTFMEQYRMISLYPKRIAAAKVDDIVDAWRTLEAIRQRANDTWRRRAEITPSFERREKPPALEIFKRLPRTNCRACGEATCLAFAVRLWNGQVRPSQCAPVFDDAGSAAHLRDALIEICMGLGVFGDRTSPYHQT